MINLLADERKDDIRAARTNVLLSRYIAILLMALAFLMGYLLISYTVLQNTKNSAEATIETNDIKADVYSDTKSQVDTLSSKLAETKTVLDQEIRFSKVITNLGQFMPAGTIIDSLDLSDATLSGAPVEIKAYATSNETAAEITPKLQTSPVVLQAGLLGTDSAAGIEGYPISVTLTVMFNKAGAK